MAKTNAHIRYRLNDKTIVPGVTTILGLRSKPQLVPWANKLGLEGINVSAYVDDKADIGTLAHAMITNSLIDEKTDLSDYDPKQISQAENSFLSYLEWEKHHPIKAIWVEKPLVHEELKFGGTADIYTETCEIIDLKTGSGIYSEHRWQVATLKQLLVFNGFGVNKCSIINIPRSEDEKFQYEVLSERDLEKGWSIFQHLLAIYYEEKEK